MLSKYFSLEEATYSETASRLGIENTPNAEQLANMTLAARRLDELRENIGKPIIVNSWLRIPRLNASIPGSSKTSHHVTGFSIDCRVNGMSALELCKRAESIYRGGGFDQIIHEFGSWMHISFHPDSRKQTLTIFKNTKGLKYKSGLLSQSEYMDS
jgi:hypothetical protein